MGKILASSTIEIAAPLDRVWERVADIEGSPAWQRGLLEVRVHKRDREGRATVCESRSDAKVRTVTSVVRVTYDAPTRLTWTQERGDLKSIEGSWELEDLGRDRTRATYSLEVDPGPLLGMVFRGPLASVARDMLVGSRPGELKRVVEATDTVLR
jgi:carbon monoxide dehydrogenase subunit G